MGIFIACFCSVGPSSIACTPDPRPLQKATMSIKKTRILAGLATEAYWPSMLLPWPCPQLSVKSIMSRMEPRSRWPLIGCSTVTEHSLPCAH